MPIYDTVEWFIFINCKAGALVEVRTGDELHPFSLLFGLPHYLRPHHGIQYRCVGENMGFGARDL